jgi:hypothetical protein
MGLRGLLYSLLIVVLRIRDDEARCMAEQSWLQDTDRTGGPFIGAQGGLLTRDRYT